MYEDTVTLIRQEIGADDLGNQVILSETGTEVFGQVESVGQSEHFAAARSGLAAELRVSVCSLDYSGEAIAELAGRKWRIYRTFRRDDDRTELYLTGGAKNGEP